MSVAAAVAPQERPPLVVLGRSFVHPLFDYLVIGGGLSLLVTALLKWGGRTPLQAFMMAALPLLVLFSNSAHFAASTVRLYTKPGSFRDRPFLTMGLPLVTLLVLLACLGLAPVAGRHLQSLYLTWSPYHYAAQAYGLALIYCYRSGCAMDTAEKRFLRLTCLLPFLFSILNGRGVGVDWLVPASVLSLPAVDAARQATVQALGVLALALPLVFALRPVRGRPAVPLISLTIIFANAVWWVTLVFLDAFVWATVFHGLQYLAIVLIFHRQERAAAGTARGSGLSHVFWFYLACLTLGYLLFQAWPLAFLAAGYGFVESVILVTAVVNIHHFIVDAYIWRLRRDPNYRLIATDGSVPAVA
jgi:hypothetical protein